MLPLWVVDSTLAAWSAVAIISTPTHLRFSGDVLLPYTSRHVTACDQLYQASSVFVLQATNTGVKVPGYEAREIYYWHMKADHVGPANLPGTPCVVGSSALGQ